MKKLLLTIAIISTNASAFCFEEAGRVFDVNPKLLKAIAFTESAMNPSAFNDKNRNGTADYGLMQINSTWFERLEAKGISRDVVINDPCTNVFVGAWILAQNFETSGETWLSVGAYNAGYSKRTEGARKKYIGIVQTNLARLIE
ncbi:twitching motility protein PilT [Vibrio breoganii]|uniref:Twitching motility protein PilT n=1 Tax=Vibrio breoganii TaxID=553239 RepID=A0AAP8MYW4_9VIBR|nr:lytic transglycosylase domain-containing protein [Vibrio breoganii]PMK78549.1 twitching motility protein PilT [Vibrio breoganii]PMP14009.1 twitching motility protein PilT [Vibrio breoganii]